MTNLLDDKMAALVRLEERKNFIKLSVPRRIETCAGSLADAINAPNVEHRMAGVFRNGCSGV